MLNHSPPSICIFQSETREVMDNLSTQGDELRTQQELLDTAVKTWEELLPGCVADPGMSEPALVRNLRIRTLRVIFIHLLFSTQNLQHLA